MAIGSGKLYGKGLNNNTIADVTVSDTGFVSEQQTDFIFSVVGEETGFIGSVIVIALLAIIMIECFKTAYVAKNMSGRLIAVGMAALIGFQSFINIGVATELLPNYRLAVAICKLWINIIVKLYGRYRDCAKCRITKTLLGGENI